MSSQLEETLTVNMRITGKVQGVGFRYFVLRQAREHGIYGWVHNLPTGDVEALKQGAKEDVDQFIVKVKVGTSFSRVDEVNLEWLNEAEQYFGFEII